MSKKILLEIAANSLPSAMAAQRGGADRIELCDFLEGGGVTPSFATIALSREHLQIPLHVLIRPRVGDFLYTREEIDIMLRDITQCLRLGCDGVVIGALTADGDIDVALCQELMQAAGDMRVIFHRAFDCAVHFDTAWQALQTLGVHGLLSSGRAATAMDGSEVLAHCVQLAQASAMQIIAGAGVNADKVQNLLAATQVSAVHASAKSPIKSSARMKSIVGLQADYWQTSEALVRKLVDAIAGFQVERKFHFQRRNIE